MRLQKPEIVSYFKGELASSARKMPHIVEVTVNQLDDLNFKFSFEYEEVSYSFRCLAEVSDDGFLLRVQNIVSPQYIIEGKSGILSKNQSVHGGFLNQNKGLYFHISINYFTGTQLELFFFGKKTRKIEKEDTSLLFKFL